MAAKAPETPANTARLYAPAAAPAKKPAKEVRIPAAEAKARTPSPEPAEKEPEKEEEPADDVDNESVADSEAEKKKLTYRALNVFAPPVESAKAALTLKEAAEKRDKMLQTLDSVRKRGKQCTYFGPRMVQCPACPPLPKKLGRCSRHENSVSYAPCKREGCKGSTRNEVGLCDKCTNKARVKVNRDSDEERRLQCIERIMALDIEEAEKKEIASLITRSKKERVALRLEEPDQ